jgi:transcriptional regulator with XRE-family HTH domain
MSSTGKPVQTTDRSLPVGKIVRPDAGWLRAIREDLGITLAELAGRLKVTPPAVRSFEQAEAEDRITLASLRRTAAAMDCDLIYALVPRGAGKPATPRTPRPVRVESARPAPPPERQTRDSPASIVTDLTRHTEYGEP